MPAQPQQNQGDNSAGLIWGVAAAFVAVGAIWFVFKNQIIAFYLTIKLYETDVLSFFYPSHYDHLRSILASAVAHPGNVQFKDLALMGNAVGNFYKYPFTVLLLACAFVVYLSNTTRVFKRTYVMKDLAKLEKPNWPQITPIVGLDLVKTDIDKGPWAMSMTPMQFCKRYRLLEEVRPQRREGMSRKEWGKVEVVLKRGEANKLFALQLGPLWKGVDKLPPHIKALFAVFAARINADTKAAGALLTQMNASSGTRLNFHGVDALLKKHLNTKPVQSILQSHAYVFTVMIAMLVGAREDGVQASADFLWLKPLDRRLWYTLNTVGRQTPFTEVAGIYAHYLAEKEGGIRLFVPMVEEATKALELALKEVVYRADEV